MKVNLAIVKEMEEVFFSGVMAVDMKAISKMEFRADLVFYIE